MGAPILKPGEDIERDFLIEINKGNIEGHRLLHKFGFSDVVSTTHHHLWNAPTNIDLAWQQTASEYDVYSSDANDDGDPAGSGALTVKLKCLDASFNEIEETVVLNGTTPVTTTGGPYIRVWRAEVVSVGTYTGSNEGNIRIEVTSGGAKTGDLQAYIEIGEGQTQKSQYTIPAGETAYLLRTSITVDTNKATKVELHVRANAHVTSSPMGADLIKHQWDGLKAPVEESFNANHVFLEKTDIWLDAEVDAGTAIVEADYDILLVSDDL